MGQDQERGSTIMDAERVREEQPPGRKSLRQLMVELQEHRKWQHRSFKRTDDDDTWIVLMFAHDQYQNLTVIVQRASMAQIKEVVYLDTFKQEFVQHDTGGVNG
jgi:hypothetical protein